MSENREKACYDLINLPDYGEAYIFWSGKILEGLFFKIAGGEELKDFIAEMAYTYKNQDFSLAEGAGVDWVEKIISGKVEIDLTGSDLEKKVWTILQKIPCGQTWNYTQVAVAAGFPKAVRAVASAIGRNHLSLVIPCHRVVRIDGRLGGYRFGIDLKKKILEKEKKP